jgi:rod shape-determining protein MreD
MRNMSFLLAGLALLVVQANFFRALDGLRPGAAVAVAAVALVVDLARGLRGSAHPRIATSFRADLTLPALVLVAYALATTSFQLHVGRPIPALVLPLILFMGVREYSLPLGALVSFVLGYVTDVLGIAPVGLYTFTFVATFVLARAAGVRLAAQTVWMQVVLVAAFALLQSVMVLVLLAIFGRDAWVPRALYPLVLPHALATASFAPAVFHLAQVLHTATAGGAPRAEPGSTTA